MELGDQFSNTLN